MLENKLILVYIFISLIFAIRMIYDIRKKQYAYAAFMAIPIIILILLILKLY
ncbi:MAG: hypothetical protein RR769_06615 [Anaerovoracaceae bacterium]